MPLVLILLGIGIYLVPTIIAWRRLHPNRTTIFILNLLAGWTLVGWVAALVWSTSRKRIANLR
jgi:hypothetical protein